MDLTERRQEFTVFILDSDSRRNGELRESLSDLGYEVLSFGEFSVLKTQLAEVVPHIIVFAMDSISSVPVQEIFDSASKVSSEIMFVPIVESGKGKSFSQKSLESIFQVIELGSGWIYQVTRTVDHAVERLCYIYQNEQLIEKVGRLKVDYDQLKTDLYELRVQNASAQENLAHVQNASPGLNALHKFELEIEKLDNREAMLQSYLNFLGKVGGDGTRIVFFRFLPSVHSFLTTHSFGMEDKNLQGVGFRLNPSELRGYKQLLKENKSFPSLEKLIREGFSAEEPKLLPLFVDNELEGLFVILSKADSKDGWNDKMEMTFELARMSFTRAYRILTLEKKLAEAGAFDEPTKFMLYASLMPKVTDEITRARRITSPVSLIVLKVDQLRELEQELGDAGRDLWLRSFAAAARKITRTYDFCFRVSYDEFALLLPHAPLKGAAVLAERLRRMVESTSLVQHSLKVTLSSGVSEFPTLCSTPEELVKSAQLALTQVTRRGGNKVCLSSAPTDFKPEFEVSTRP